jgi:hypothetical protein
VLVDPIDLAPRVTIHRDGEHCSRISLPVVY